MSCRSPRGISEGVGLPSQAISDVSKVSQKPDLVFLMLPRPQRCCQMPPRWTQDGVGLPSPAINGGSEVSQKPDLLLLLCSMPPRCCQMPPRWVQGGPKMSPGSPQMLERCSQMLHRCRQHLCKRHQNNLQMRPGMPQGCSLTAHPHLHTALGGRFRVCTN